MPFDPPHPRAGRVWQGLRVGLLGGSFNPAHYGHRYIAEAALTRLGLDCVWWLISPQNPLKQTAGMAPFADRMAGARAVIADHPRMVATDIESQLGLRHTAALLRRLDRLFPNTGFTWIMGADNLGQIDRWQDWRSIFAALDIAVFARAPYSLTALRGQAAVVHRAQRRSAAAMARRTARVPSWCFVPIPLQTISATDLRRKGMAQHQQEGHDPGAYDHRR